MDEGINGRTDGWMDKGINGRTDGWTDGWMDGWMDGWTTGSLFSTRRVPCPSR